MLKRRLVFELWYTRLRLRACGHRLLSRRFRARILTHSHLQEAILNVFNNGGRPGALSDMSQMSTDTSSIYSTEGSLARAGSGVDLEPVREAENFVSSGDSFALQQCEVSSRDSSQSFVSSGSPFAHQQAQYASSNSEFSSCRAQDGRGGNAQDSSGGSLALAEIDCRLLAEPSLVFDEETQEAVRMHEDVGINMPPIRQCSDEHRYLALPRVDRGHDSLPPVASSVDSAEESERDDISIAPSVSVETPADSAMTNSMRDSPQAPAAASKSGQGNFDEEWDKNFNAVRCCGMRVTSRTGLACAAFGTWLLWCET